MKKNDEIGILVRDAVIKNEDVWFVADQYSGLYTINLNTNIITCCGKIPWERPNTERLYEALELVENQIYLIPSLADSICIYDIDSNEFSKLEFDYNIVGKSSDFTTLFMATCVWNNKLFVFGAEARAILCIDTITKKIIYITDWVNKITPLIFNEKDAFFRKQAVVLNDKIYIPFCNANAILTLDCNTLETEIKRIGNTENGYSGITFDGNCFWCSPREINGSLVRWDYIRNSVVSYKLCDFEPEIKGTIGLIHDNDIIKLFSTYSKGSYKFDCKEYQAELKNGNYKFVRECESYILYYDMTNRMLSLFDKLNHNNKELHISVPYSMTNLNETLANKIIAENEIIGLEQFFYII